MGKIVSFLIILGGFLGGYMLFQDYAKGVKVRNNHWGEDLRGVVKAYSSDALAAVNDAPGVSDAVSYYRMLGVMNAAERHGYSVGDTVRTGFSGCGLPPGQAKMAIDLVLENYNIAKRLGVFDSPQNVLRLERGEAPLCAAKGWDDEPLVLGHLLSPVLAPEAAFSLVNVVLMPKCARDTQNEEPTGFTPEMARKWAAEHVITPDSLQAIYAAMGPRKY